jgi:drug/metabolite transporter (DMT)-like permease
MDGVTSIDDRQRRKVGIASVAGVVLLFCSFTLMSRKGLTGTFQIADLAWLRFSGGALLLLPWFLRSGLAGLGVFRALVLALCGGIGFATLAYSGFKLAPAAHAGVLLHGTLPLFGTLFGMLILRQFFSARRGVGVGVIFVGIAIIASDSVAGSRGNEVLRGDLFLLAASVAWSLYGALLARWKVAAMPAAAMVSALSFVFFGLFSVASRSLPRIELSLDYATQALFQGVFIGAGSILLYSKAVTALGATTTALAITAVPVLTVLGAIPLLSELPSAQTSIGAALATAGMMVALLGTASGNRAAAR